MIVPTGTYYDMLEVQPDATRDQIRAAFRRLARLRHPDRFQGEARAAAERDFQAITEAYNVLVDDSRRAQYDQTSRSKRSEVQMSPQEISRAYLAKAVGLMKAGQMVEAEQSFASSVAHDAGNARARHLYGMFLGQQPGRLDEALRQIDQAVRLDPGNARLLLDASKLFTKGKMVARATRFAQQAAQLAPDDPGVQAWLQQLQISGGNA